jgi:hypothetical protein
MPPPRTDCYDYVRRYYGVPAHVGAQVRELKAGATTRGVLVRKLGSQQYVWVRWDGETKTTGPYHPTDLEYLGAQSSNGVHP